MMKFVRSLAVVAALFFAGCEDPIDDGGNKSVDDVAYASLAWDRGGFTGKPDAEVKALITGLSVSGNGLTYKWQEGGCENLGAASATDAACVACLFVKTGGKWHGGKFDWISTSRRSRGFENIRGDYHGWTQADLDKAEDFAFVIVSGNGKYRTNVLKK